MSKSKDIRITRVIDQLCNDFEERWSASVAADFESYLKQVDKSQRHDLLHKMLEVDIELRKKAGQGVTADDYQQLGEQAMSFVGELLQQPSLTKSRSRNDSDTNIEVDLNTDSSETKAPRILSDIEPEHELNNVGRYQIERILGKGGFGLVYLAYDDQLERHVAVKVPHLSLVSSLDHAAAYLKEARTVANLDHPNIVAVYDVGQTDEFPCYIVSKYIEGTDLSDQVKQHLLSHTEAAELVATVAEALHYAHKQGLVHRDIKPGNILIGNDGKPYVVDFGLALRDAEIGSRPEYAGTPAYMSPEQARGEGHLVDGRSDIYSLGTVMYELLVGRRPFSGQTQIQLIDQITSQEVKPPRQIDDSIPKELERICLKSLAKKASERYTTALDMADDLRRHLKEHGLGSQTFSAESTPEVEMQQMGDINPLLKPFWRFLDNDLRQILIVAATLAQIEDKNYVSTTNFVKALMVLKPGRISAFFSELPAGALPESISEEIPIQLSALQALESLSPCINSAMTSLTPEVLPEEKLSSEDVYIDIARFAKGKSTQRLRSHGVSRADVEKIVAQLGWQLVQRKSTMAE